MGFTGHRNLANQLFPTPTALRREVRRYSTAELLPLGENLLATHIRRVMNVRRGTFERSIVPRMEPRRYRLRWLVAHPGANIQDEGGTITARPGKRLIFMIPGVGVRSARSVTLKPRRYFTSAINDIADTSTRLLQQHMTRWVAGGTW